MSIMNSMRVQNQKLNTSGSFMVMYHGAVVPGRDIERLIELVEFNKKIKAIILGNSNDSYKKELEDLVIRYDVKDRIIFHPGVSLKELWKYVGAADAGIILARATCKNHLFSLPNKLFENIQAGTPVICPSYPAFTQIIEKYNCGLMCNPDDIEDINNCIEAIRNNQTLYDQLKTNTLKAKEELNWEIEKRSLRAAYVGLIDD